MGGGVYPSPSGSGRLAGKAGSSTQAIAGPAAVSTGTVAGVYTAWTEVDPATSVKLYVVGFNAGYNSAGSGTYAIGTQSVGFDVGFGASGSEVVKASHLANVGYGSILQAPLMLPIPALIPAGSRLVVRAVPLAINPPMTVDVQIWLMTVPFANVEGN